MVKISNYIPQKSYSNLSGTNNAIVSEHSSVFEDTKEKKEVIDIKNLDDQMKSEQERKKAKRIKIMIGIGLTVAAAGLAIYDLKRQNSLLKNLFKKCALKTKIGRNIKDGVDFAKEAKNVPMETIQQEGGNVLTQVKEKISSDGAKICERIAADEVFVQEGAEFVSSKCRANEFLLSQIEHSKTSADAIQGVIELGGTGPTKFAQIISNETQVMSQIEQVSPDLASALRSTKSRCSFSRTLDEATAFLEEAFPGKGYVLEKELSAGSIGATYLAKKPDGTQVVVKMIKKGITSESLQAEQSFFERVIPKITDSEEEIESLRKMSKDLYRDWAGELDFFQSLKYNRAFSEGAGRYSVAQIREISQNGKCLVMDIAKGIRMDQLMVILKDYKMNPSEFYTKYASLIEANPWLANPDKVIKELSPTILKAFDEQFLFIKKGATSIMHGDPHTGNFFVTATEKGKLALEFIDTDNCVLRNAAQIKADLKMISNYCVGNEQKIAEYFIDLCKCPSEKRAELIKNVAADIRSSMFGKRTNIRDIKTFMENIKVILRKYGLNISGNTTSLKAQIQFLSAANEAAHLSGGSLNVSTIIKDIPRAGFCMIRSGINPFSCVKDAISYAINNLQNALGSSLQFVMA